MRLAEEEKRSIGTSANVSIEGVDLLNLGRFFYEEVSNTGHPSVVEICNRVFATLEVGRTVPQKGQ